MLSEIILYLLIPVLHVWLSLTPQWRPCVRIWTVLFMHMHWQHFFSVQPRQAHLPGIPLRITAENVRRFAFIHNRSLLKMKPMWNGLQDLGVLSDLFFPKPQVYPIPSSHSEGESWRASASLMALMAGRPVSSEQSLLTRAITAWTVFHFTNVSSPDETSPPPIP